jgi:hypothetical protein
LNDELTLITLSQKKAQTLWPTMNKMATATWSPKNHNVVAIGTRGNEILLIDIHTKVMIKKLRASHGFVTEIRWNPGGEGVILAKHELSKEIDGGGVHLTMHATEGEEKQVQQFEH